ncbi:MAG: MFS transporter [Gammaproteobacteria bacterium]|nr:MFS transporter [Gammaproteobacteria bacterium]MBU1416070.1 MFS transporter [Gammaproteobacteria bacterium]
MSTARVFSYGLLGLPLAFAALPIYVHVPRYYAETAGMELAMLGAILLGARLLDAGIDPWLGWLADRVPRPTMVAVALLPFAVGFVALLNPPNAHAAPWLLGSLALTYLGFSAATVAYQAWGADVGSTSRLRTRLTAAREGFGLVGVVLAAALPAVLAADFVTGVERLSWVLPPVLLMAALVTFSRVAGGASRSPMKSQPWWHATRDALADRAFRRLLLVFVANGIASALPATLFLFFVADVLQLEAASGPLLALYFVAGAASLTLWVKLAARYGRVAAWFAAMLLSIIAFAGASQIGSGDLWPFAAICLASGMALGADLALPAAIAADIGERMRQAGACFGLWNFVAKLNLALAAGLSLPLLAALGYAPGNTEGLSALVFAYALLPLAFKAIAAVMLWRWRSTLEIER